jgi:hypothetical protein
LRPSPVRTELHDCRCRIMAGHVPARL